MVSANTRTDPAAAETPRRGRVPDRELPFLQLQAVLGLVGYTAWPLLVGALPHPVDDSWVARLFGLGLSLVAVLGAFGVVPWLRRHLSIVMTSLSVAAGVHMVTVLAWSEMNVSAQVIVYGMAVATILTRSWNLRTPAISLAYQLSFIVAAVVVPLVVGVPIEQAIVLQVGLVGLTAVTLSARSLDREFETELARTGAQQRALVTALRDVLIRVDAEGRIVEVDHAPDDLLGEHLSAAVGRPIDALFPGAADLDDHLEVVLDELGKVVDLRSVDDEAGGRWFVVRDDTVAARLRDRMVHEEKLWSLGSLAAGVAHTVNNPLTAITAGIDVAQARVEDLAVRGEAPADARLLEALKQAAEGAEQVAAAVRDLDVYTREDESHGVVDLAEVARSAVRMADMEIRHRATVSLEVGQRVEVVVASERLRQVVVSLLLNAADAMPPGRTRLHNRIVVRVRRRGHEAVLEVEDNGQGMSESVARRVFDPFFTTKNVGEGSGMSLYVSRSVLRRMGGDLRVSSTLQRGSSFSLVLPARQSRTDSPEPVVRERVPVAAPRVGRLLVVDDEPLVLRAIGSALSGHDVLGVRDGVEALAACERHTFDLILCDLMMPELDGEGVYRELKRHRPELAARMVFVTGGVLSEDTRAFLEAVDVPLLKKPFDRKRLREVVDEQLERLGAVDGRHRAE